MPVTSLHPLPDAVDDVAGALVEPGGNALRAVRAPGPHRATGCWCSGRARSGLRGVVRAGLGAEVHVVGRSERSRTFARAMGRTTVWDPAAIPALPWDAVVDATNDPAAPALAVDLVEPGRRVVLVGLAGSASLVDTRTVALKDVTVVGILGGSAGLDGAIERYASGDVDPCPLVGATIALEDLAGALADAVDGRRPAGAGPGPKLHIDPRR